MITDFIYSLMLLVVPCVFFLAKAFREKAKKEMLEWLALTSALLGFLIMIYKGR